MDDDQTRVFYKGQDVTAQILSEENGSRASVVSQIPEVRQALLRKTSATVRSMFRVWWPRGAIAGPWCFPRPFLRST